MPVPPVSVQKEMMNRVMVGLAEIRRERKAAEEQRTVLLEELEALILRSKPAVRI